MTDKTNEHPGFSLETGDCVAYQTEDGRMFVGVVVEINPLGSNGWDIQITDRHEIATLTPEEALRKALPRDSMEFEPVVGRSFTLNAIRDRWRRRGKSRQK